MRVCFTAILFFCLIASASFAQVNLNFPGSATATFSDTTSFDSYKLPVGPYSDGVIQTIVAEGPLAKLSWRVNAPGATTLGVMDSLRQQLEQVGFELLYECETRECGGFDFRFGTEVLPEPSMHIDLGDFRYLAAQRLGQAVPEYISLFVSRSSDFSFVQMILVGGADQDGVGVAIQEQITPAIPTRSFGSVIEALEANGAAVLEDLDFATGSSRLGEGPFDSLKDLGAYLKANPSRQIALVGHTDAVGARDGNIALSRKRAQAAAQRLIEVHDVPAGQVSADGVGYLAPRATNLTEEGRTKNRRVEVVLTSTQ
jgi:OOP family OmpA-OmpF porin